MRLAAAGLVILAFAVTAIARSGARPPLPVSRFSETTEGWQAIPPPTAPQTEMALTSDAGAARALRLRYRVTSGKLAGVMRQVTGLQGGGIRLRVRVDTPAPLVVGCVERDGSAYMRVVQVAADTWVTIEAPFATLVLSDDSRDENGALDLPDVSQVVIADASGFMPTSPVDRILLLDDIDLGADVRGLPARSYEPLLPAGPASQSGARATRGVTYASGRHGSAMVAERPGAQAIVPVRGSFRPGWRWQEGTIEMWVSPRAPFASIPDYSGLLALQQEPFAPGLKGSLQLFVTSTHQLAFMLDGSTEKLAPTPPLAWQAGEWHHVTIAWGPAGMRTYLDGRRVGSNPHKGGPALPAADLVVGSHAWTLVSGRPAMMAFDDLRVSSRQRTDEEVAAAARAASPAPRDADTAALERFDGVPRPPARAVGGSEPWHTFTAGTPVVLRLAPASSGAAYTVTTPAGRRVAVGSVRAGVVRVGALAQPGFYRVRAGTADEWVRVVPRGPGAPRDALFGASACYAQAQESERYFRLAAQAGVRTLRMPFEWYEIEPTEGRFAWDKYDRIVTWAHRHGVELIPTFIWEKPQPAWAGPGEARSGTDSQRHPPTDMARWSRFVTAVVGRYKRTVRWWIPANEPNLARYWFPRPDAAAYVDLLRVTREAVRKADPSAKVLGLNLAGVDLRFLRECLEAGALAHCDAVGIHPYICPHDPDERIPVNIMDPGSQVGTWREGLLAARALIAKHGGRHKLWLDEAGQPYRDDFISPDWGRPEPEAAAILAKQLVEARSSGCVDRVLWFSFFGAEYGSFALVRPDGSPSLPLAAYCAAQNLLRGAQPAGSGRRGADFASRLFTTPSGRLEVVWRTRGTGAIALAAGQTARDHYGFALTANRARRVAIGQAPVFIRSR